MKLAEEFQPGMTHLAREVNGKLCELLEITKVNAMMDGITPVPDFSREDDRWPHISMWNYKNSNYFKHLGPHQTMAQKYVYAGRGTSGGVDTKKKTTKRTRRRR